MKKKDIATRAARQAYRNSIHTTKEIIRSLREEVVNRGYTAPELAIVEEVVVRNLQHLKDTLPGVHEGKEFDDEERSPS